MSSEPSIDDTTIDRFAREMDELRSSALAGLRHEDFEHLTKFERLGRLLSVIGYLTAWIFPNPLSIVCISQGIITRWLLMHHIGHGGYDKVPGVPLRYTSKHFAMGWRRYIDWFDWIDPEAWNCEHNILHHYHTGEHGDPDLVEDHAEFLRAMRIPKFLKYIALFFFGISWKFIYYAPNTLSALHSYKTRTASKGHTYHITFSNAFDLRNPLSRRLWFYCYAPYGMLHFVLVPLLFLPLGQTAVLYYLINRLLAEALTNFHTYMIIAPNHAGEDLYRFDTHFKGKRGFYLNQVIGTVNYHCGSDAIDYPQMWLNYQIEHHLFPNLPMTTYREIQPEVKRICKAHGVPYIQESIFRRFKKFVDICVGDASMIRVNDGVDSLSNSPSH
jgi:fatty acid desaturase